MNIFEFSRSCVASSLLGAFSLIVNNSLVLSYKAMSLVVSIEIVRACFKLLEL